MGKEYGIHYSGIRIHRIREPGVIFELSLGTPLIAQDEQ